MSKLFPLEVFEDISPSSFKKYNKKHVSEDFVAENFKKIGWIAFKPFVDTGIDLIIIKKVCPEQHTEWNENTKDYKKCKICNRNLIKIIRFIQIKTREIKSSDEEENNEEYFFGFTLKSKDFRTDPRHTFIFYSDYTNDMLIFPVYKYLKLAVDYPEISEMHFFVNSFRQGNNKINNIKYNKRNMKWFWKTRRHKIDLSEYLNENGVKLISDPLIDLNFEYVEKSKQVGKIKLELFFNNKDREISRRIRPIRENDEGFVEELNQQRINILNRIRDQENSDEIIRSINKYLEQFEGLRIE